VDQDRRRLSARHLSAKTPHCAPPFRRDHEVTLSILKQAVLAIGLSGLANAVRGQIPRSQLGVVTQSVGTARVEITYRRPVARGRDLFGALVPYGRVWTPS